MAGFAKDADGVGLTRPLAEEAWAAAAQQVLTRTASVYHAVIEYGELATEVQELTGIVTNVEQRNWIGSVLAKVAHLGAAKGEPPLTALVVRAGSGVVGDGYNLVLELAGIDPLDDPVQREDHAAVSRLRCYQWAGVAEPSGGWTPALAPALQRARDRKAKQAGPAKPTAMCPRCHMVLPLSGQCDNCN